MAETNPAAGSLGKPDPIRATLLNGESVSASVEVGCETQEVAINILTHGDVYHLLLTGEGAMALRIIAVVGRLRRLDQPTE